MIPVRRGARGAEDLQRSLGIDQGVVMNPPVVIRMELPHQGLLDAQQLGRCHALTGHYSRHRRSGQQGDVVVSRQFSFWPALWTCRNRRETPAGIRTVATMLEWRA